MCKIFFAILFSCSFAHAQAISVDQDSLRIYNSPAIGSIDEVIFRSASSDSVHFDSAHIMIAEMDTVGLSMTLIQKTLEVRWCGDLQTNQTYIWTMESVAPNTFKLIKDSFYPLQDPPLGFSGSTEIGMISGFEIGSCFTCKTFPTYPRYFRGTMRLFFSNGQAVELKLWSNDLRVGVRGTRDQHSSSILSPSSFPYKYLANGRRVGLSDRTVIQKNRISSVKVFEKN
jgi:hypothetical protein